MNTSPYWNPCTGDVEGRRAARAYMQASTAICHHEVVAVHLRPAPVRPAHLRRHEAHGGDGAPHPGQGDRALPGRPRLPPRVRPRPAAGGARLPAARLRRGAAVRPRGHVPGRGRRPVQVLRVQRRRLVGHEREPRDHGTSVARLEATFRGVRGPPPGGGLRAVRVAGWTRSCDIYGTYERRVATPRVAIVRLPGERRGGRVPRVRAAVRAAAAWRARWPTCGSSALRRRGAARRGGATHRRGVAALRDERRDRPLGRVAAAHRRRAGGQKVALIGSFAGHLAHDKQLFKRAVRRCARRRFWTPTRCRSWRRRCR